MCRFNIAVFVVMLLILNLSLNPLSYAQSDLDKKIDEQVTKTVDEKYKNTESKLETNLQKHIDAQISKILDDKFKEAASRLENQSNRHFESINKVFDDMYESFKWLVSCGGGVLIVLAGIGAALLWGHNKSIREHIKEEFENTQKSLDAKITEIKQQYTQESEELKKKLNEFDKLKNDYEHALAEIKILNEKIKPLIAFKDKKIVWTFETLDADSKAEIQAIEKEGFVVDPWPVGDEASLAKDKYDLMIYSFSKSENSVKRLKNIVDFLKSTKRDIPLIIYTYNGGDRKYINDRDEQDKNLNEILKTYQNYVMANMPLTLKSYFNSLIRN
jgi:hypothetical protein